MAQFVPTHSQAALDVVATERDRVAAEQDAFGTFHDRIEALDAARASSAGDSGQQTGALLGGMPALKKSLQRAREAYRETVMSVPITRMITTNRSRNTSLPSSARRWPPR